MRTRQRAHTLRVRDDTLSRRGARRGYVNYVHRTQRAFWLRAERGEGRPNHMTYNVRFSSRPPGAWWELVRGHHFWRVVELERCTGGVGTAAGRRFGLPRATSSDSRRQDTRTVGQLWSKILR